MIWPILGVMLLVAIAFVTWPLYRRQRKISVSAIAAALAVVAVAGTLYSQIGTPDAEPAPADANVPSIDQMVSSLAARLAENPEDVAGWKMLGRSYIELRRFPEAVSAYERAVDIESGSNAQTLADLGEAMMLVEQGAIDARAGELFESALAISPNNPKALFYAGLAAVNRGDNELAATRWEALLATSPPANIEQIIRQRIAELRGEAPSEPVVSSEQPGAVVTVNVALSDQAAAGSPADATVFIIARDPAQPSPPIAAVRRRVSELPAVVAVGDSDAMIPGRVPSGFERLEVLARVSLSGQPIAQAGDWFGTKIVEPQNEQEFSIVIDEQVP